MNEVVPKTGGIPERSFVTRSNALDLPLNPLRRTVHNIDVRASGWIAPLVAGFPEAIVDFRALPHKCPSKIDRHFPDRVDVEIVVGRNVACCRRPRPPENHRSD